MMAKRISGRQSMQLGALATLESDENLTSDSIDLKNKGEVKHEAAGKAGERTGRNL